MIHLPLAVHPGYREASFDCLLQSLMTAKCRLAAQVLWPIGETSGDAEMLRKGLEASGAAGWGDPLSGAVAALFARDGLPAPGFALDGCVALP